MKQVTCLVSVIFALALFGCGGGGSGGGSGDGQVAKPNFTLPNVISAVPPQQ
jgi:hypothetical protein